MYNIHFKRHFRGWKDQSGLWWLVNYERMRGTKIKKMRKAKRQWQSGSTALDGVVRSSKTWGAEGADHRSTWGREFKPLAITGAKSLGRVCLCFFKEYLCVYKEYQGGLQGWRIWKAREAIRDQTSKNVPMAKFSVLKDWKGHNISFL